MKQQNSASVSRICRADAQSKHDGGKEAPAYAGSSTPTAAHLVFFFLVLLVGTFVSTRWINTYSMIGSGGSRPAASHDQTRYPQLTCPTVNRPTALSCPAMPPPPQYPHTIIPPSTTPAACREVPSPAGLCPAYFRWIHEDLQPWARTGITREMVERAKESASFRLVVLGGRAYVERYGRRTFQTRDLFTQWGILQLLRRHPGRVPDLELMFDCVDHPAVMKSAYPGDWEDTTPVPPLFRYSGDDSTLDIVFPDWSLCGWSRGKARKRNKRGAKGGSGKRRRDSFDLLSDSSHLRCLRRHRRPLLSSMAGLSLRCGDCRAHLKSVEEAQQHAELTSHTNFAESPEAVLNLVCTTCGKPSSS